MKVMILAAGQGQRMLPLTENLPKPLLAVGGKTLLDHRIEALRCAGFTEFVLNLHYLGDQIRAHLGDGSQLGIEIQYSDEDELLETAGGIHKALPLLGDQPFAVVSADTFTDYDFQMLRNMRLDRRAHLVMVDNPEHHPEGDYAIDEEGLLSLAGTKLTYAGMGLFSPEFFSSLQPGRRMLRELFDRSVNLSEISAEYYSGFWRDVGTPERLYALRERRG